MLLHLQMTEVHSHTMQASANVLSNSGSRCAERAKYSMLLYCHAPMEASNALLPSHCEHCTVTLSL
jgi:hypothetical protein